MESAFSENRHSFLLKGYDFELRVIGETDHINVHPHLSSHDLESLRIHDISSLIEDLVNSFDSFEVLGLYINPQMNIAKPTCGKMIEFFLGTIKKFKKFSTKTLAIQLNLFERKVLYQDLPKFVLRNVLGFDSKGEVDYDLNIIYKDIIPEKSLKNIVKILSNE